MKTLVDLCNEYGIPLRQEDANWHGPCPWSFDEPESFSIYPDQDRWQDWIMGFSGDTIQFIIMIEARLSHLGKKRFTADSWFGGPEPCPF